MRKVVAVIILALSTSMLGCSTSPVENSAIAGGVAGGAIGAGTGALIGNAMAGGDVGQSALVGGAIGIPVGIVLGVAIHELVEANERSTLDEAVEKNRDEIRANQQEIYTLREAMRNENRLIRVNSPSGRNYNGPTLGNPYR